MSEEFDYGRDWIARVWFEQEGAQDVDCGHDIAKALEIVANAKWAGMQATIFTRESVPRPIPPRCPITRG